MVHSTLVSDRTESPLPATLRPVAPVVTVQDLVTAYQQLHLPTLKQPASVRCRLSKYFGPLLALPVDALTVPIVLGWVNEIRRHSTTQADGCLTILRSMINKAIEWQLWTGQSNPAAFVRRKRASPRTRYILEHELPGLIRELEREPVFIRLYFYLVLFCAPRPGEVERAQRPHFLPLPEGGCVWFKPTTKTTEHSVQLPEPITRLLSRHLEVLSPATPWIFPGRRGRCLSKEFWHARWVEIRERCGLHDVQLRDLRRTTSTHLLGDKEMDLMSLSKGVLNHSNLNTTQVYARPKLERVGEMLNTYMHKTLAKAGVRS
jgi:integrase